jgi:hypothetical protein
MLISGDADEVLFAAKHLTLLDGIAPVSVDCVTYVHVMCEAHEIILVDGVWTESFQPADASLCGLDHAAPAEVLALFPELQGQDALEYVAARPSLRKHEAMVLLASHSS